MMEIEARRLERKATLIREGRPLWAGDFYFTLWVLACLCAVNGIIVVLNPVKRYTPSQED